MKHATIATAESDSRRAAARRMALWLGVVAVAIFVGFVGLTVLR